jgi:fructan beta-fructosidase
MSWLRALCGTVLIAPTIAADAAERSDVLVAEFEEETWGRWRAEGQAFGPGPARGTLPNQMHVSGYRGERLVNSFHGGDGTPGALTSPALRIERPYINFLIGGGRHPGETCINLLVDGEVVRTASGPNDRPGGSEQLDWHTWDVAELIGERATIEIVDRHTGGWGHINVDQIVQSDRRRQAAPASREVAIEKRYLHLPVKNGAAKRRMAFVVDGETVREFEIELADGEPDFRVFSDVSQFAGKTLTIEVDRLPEGSQGLASIVPAEEVPGPETLYREQYRPQFHFTARRGWLNDPNGLVYHDGEWHLYFQHNPYGREWGNMHWGHAVSRDLVHWRELPIALYPQRFGDWCFSGSAVVDSRNTAGFQTGDEEVIVVAYTSTGRGECIAFSNDRGRTFTEFEGNPVVRHRGRDPKVIWYGPGGHWVMAVYDEHEDKQWIAFYTSPDLKQWTYQSRIEGYFECPELFELPVDGDAKNTKWLVYGADGAYSIGEFDGTRFTAESGKHRFNWGNCFYASQLYNNVPDGRCLQVAWGRSAIPGMPFNQMMDFPVELTLGTTEEGPRLFARPVREIETLHERRHAVEDRALPPGENPLEGVRGQLFHIRARLVPGEGAKAGFSIRGIRVEYDAAAGTLTCQGQSAPLTLEDGELALEILVDRTSIEVFGGEGGVYMPIGVIPKDEDRSLAVFTRGGETRIESLEVFELRSAFGADSE